MPSAMNGSSSTISTRMTSIVGGPGISSAYRKFHTLRQHRLASTGDMTRPETSRTPVAIAFSIVIVALLGALLLCWPTLRSNGEDDERHVSSLNTTATTPSHGDAAGAEDGVLPEGASLDDD